MQYIGKLDINKLGIYKKKIITDEVILTNERLYEHILVYHKSDYELFKIHLKNIIDKPDYIIEDKQNNSNFLNTGFCDVSSVG